MERTRRPREAAVLDDRNGAAQLMELHRGDDS
jgi:hypothetical protein